MNSCIYEGWVRHRRQGPQSNVFCYRLFMMFLDLDELPTLFDRHLLWSSDGPNIVRFRRADHLGTPNAPLIDCVRDLVREHTGHRPEGPVRLLTHLRYFGYGFNPVSFYYLYDRTGYSSAPQPGTAPLFGRQAWLSSCVSAPRAGSCAERRTAVSKRAVFEEAPGQRMQAR